MESRRRGTGWQCCGPVDPSLPRVGGHPCRTFVAPRVHHTLGRRERSCALSSLCPGLRSAPFTVGRARERTGSTGRRRQAARRPQDRRPGGNHRRRPGENAPGLNPANCERERRKRTRANQEHAAETAAQRWRAVLVRKMAARGKRAERGAEHERGEEHKRENGIANQHDCSACVPLTAISNIRHIYQLSNGVWDGGLSCRTDQAGGVAADGASWPAASCGECPAGTKPHRAGLPGDRGADRHASA